MWIVARLQKFEDFELVDSRLPWPVTINPGSMIGFLGVYATKEDAEKDYPDGPFAQIEFIKSGSGSEQEVRK